MIEVRKEFLLNGWSEKDDESKENVRKSPAVQEDYKILPIPMDSYTFKQNVLCASTKFNKSKIQVILLKRNINLTKELYYKVLIYAVVANLRVLSKQQGTGIRILYPFSP